MKVLGEKLILKTIFCFIATAFLISACNKSAQVDVPEQQKTTTEKLSYPHAKGWGSPLQHGEAYKLATDKMACMACHNVEQENSLATRCDSCHLAFPHPAKFQQGRKHKDWAASFTGKCLNCHQDYTNNMPNFKDEGGCLSCHENQQLKIQWVDVPPAPSP